MHSSWPKHLARVRDWLDVAWGALDVFEETVEKVSEVRVELVLELALMVA